VRKGHQPPWMVPDGLWERIEPLLPVVPRRADHPGRKRLDDRKVLCGILFVLDTGISWEFLPQELGFGSRMTCWRRLRDWHEAGVWQQPHELLLAELNAAGALELKEALSRFRVHRKGGWRYLPAFTLAIVNERSVAPDGPGCQDVPTQHGPGADAGNVGGHG
jgi:transposase